jgi:hypothetical protein
MSPKKKQSANKGLGDHLPKSLRPWVQTLFTKKKKKKKKKGDRTFCLSQDASVPRNDLMLQSPRGGLKCEDVCNKAVCNGEILEMAPMANHMGF